tara:strand:- start:9046 stop:9888 length:843 start_codon:yes stop_codon:yes gene_type:complete
VPRRNNLERTGAPQPDAPTPPVDQTNDLFSFVNPTEFVELPSGGQLYGEDHPLHNVDTVEIRHMTAKEEDILTSETLLKRGMAIDRLVESVMVDKSIKTEDLLIGDKNAILLAARITGFGPQYEVGVTCPSCDTAQEQLFDLSEISQKKRSLRGVKTTDDGTYTFKLPKTKINIEVRLLTSRDERELSRQLEARKKQRLPENTATTLLSAIIVSANGVDDRAQLTKLVEMMPLQDSKHIRTVYDRIKPDIDMEFDFTCTNCSHDGRVTMPLTAEFFWPNG